ncbi:MAG: hypothetical protein H6662_19890 [Ardenticatenaceae bacterium]|nr:hypothetical protein [Anaerolineales bacterium]MCB8923846.1 hypothetical protein [Ardenticatenaceae bacterium]MCB9003375.1 hypothetical protein [Ardenticatenaceae bacterium]
MTQTQNLSWMWATDDTIFGLRLDKESGLLHWYEGIGCHCDEAVEIQSMVDFLRRGTPGRIAEPPADVMAELYNLDVF